MDCAVEVSVRAGYSPVPYSLPFCQLWTSVIVSTCCRKEDSLIRDESYKSIRYKEKLSTVTNHVNLRKWQ